MHFIRILFHWFINQYMEALIYPMSAFEMAKVVNKPIIDNYTTGIPKEIADEQNQLQTQKIVLIFKSKE